MRLALGAVVELVLPQLFLAGEGLQTTVQADGLRLGPTGLFHTAVLLHNLEVGGGEGGNGNQDTELSKDASTQCNLCLLDQEQLLTELFTCHRFRLYICHSVAGCSKQLNTNSVWSESELQHMTFI